MATEAEIKAGEAIIEEIERIQRVIDLIEDSGFLITIVLNGSNITIDLPTGYSREEVTEVVRSRYIIERSLKQTELSNI